LSSVYLAFALYYPALAARWHDGSSVPTRSRPSLVRLYFTLIPLLALPVGSPSQSPWVTSPKPKAVLQQSVIADRSTCTSSCVGKICWKTWCSHVTGHHRNNHSSTWGFQELQPWPPQGSSRMSRLKRSEMPWISMVGLWATVLQ
jgi:hypothetical protein